MKITKLTLSPPMLFIGYMVLSCMAILGFRLLFFSDPPPLPIYSRGWRLIQGILDFINFFPALTMSALILPFSLQNNFPQRFTSFSTEFLKRIQSSIMTAIGTAAVYGLLFFLIFPLTRDYETHLRSEGYLFNSCKEKAKAHALKDAWPEAAQFIAICERIWPNSPEIADLYKEVLIKLDEWRIAQVETKKEVWVEDEPNKDIISMYSGLSGQQNPVNVADALAMAALAIQEERYYDAHWLANLGVRLAKRGSLEQIQGTRLAKQAWNEIASLWPTTRQSRIHALYQKKRDGYEALVSEDWIKAYYIFRELSIKTPGDPDVTQFLAISEKKIRESAFFTNEMELALGEIFTEAVFSFPVKTLAERSKGRMVLQVSSLSTSKNVSYGFGIDLMAFDEEGNFLYQADARYAKIIPLTLDSGPQVLLMMHTLDHLDQNIQYKPVWTGPDHSHTGETQVLLDLSYEDFLLLSRIRRGLDSFLIGDLPAVAKKASAYGYIPEVFQAEMIYRISEAAFLFPMTILAMILGWRYRAKKRVHYLSIPMLVVLPLVFNGIVFFSRSISNIISIWLVISLGFYTTLVLFCIEIISFFILTLILLAAQHG